MTLSDLILKKSNRKTIYTIAIASGKGGVGKTSLSINLALALCLLKQKVILFDGDMGLGNVTFMLGMAGISSNLEHVITGEKRLNEIIVEGPKGLLVIPAASGTEKLANMTPDESRNLWNQFQEIEAYGDFLIVDLGAGISDMVISFLAASESSVIVTTPGKTAILDAYAVIKVLHQRNSTCKPLLFINQYQEESERIEAVNKLTTVSKKFLNIDIAEIGSMKKDWRVEKAISSQEPFLLKYGKAAITRSMYDMANFFIKKSHQANTSKSRIKSIFKQ